MRRLQNRIGFRRQIRQSSAANRLHNYNGDIPLLQNLILFLRGGIIPVIIIDLKLRKIPLTVRYKTSKSINARMTGKSQIADASFLFLLQEVFDCSTVQILVHIRICQAMQQIKINVIRLKSPKLLFKNCLIIRSRINTELSCYKKTVARENLHSLAQTFLRLSVIIDISCIEIVDSCLVSTADNLKCFRVINRCARILGIRRRQTHISHAKSR